MTTNAKTRRRQSGGSQEVLFADGTDTTVSPLPVVRPIVLATRGRIEFAGRCPKCGQMHRHVSLGKTIAPCGCRYILQPHRGRTRRAA